MICICCRYEFNFTEVITLQVTKCTESQITSLNIGREADHSPPSSAKFETAWSYTSIPPIRLHGVVLS
jgi:hypothetical protein